MILCGLPPFHTGAAGGVMVFKSSISDFYLDKLSVLAARIQIPKMTISPT